MLVLFFNCPKQIAKQRYLTRKLKGRESDDETLFEKRYEEYVRENEDIVCYYRQLGILVEIDTSRSVEESWGKLSDALKEIKWRDILK